MKEERNGSTSLYLHVINYLFLNYSEFDPDENEMSLSSDSCVDLDSKDALQLHAIANSNTNNSTRNINSSTASHILPTYDDDLVTKVENALICTGVGSLNCMFLVCPPGYVV